MEYEILVPAGIALLAIVMMGHWIRVTVNQTHRRKRQAEVYNFLLAAWADALHLPDLHDLGADAPDDVRELVADVRAALRTAERQLQLHGGRRVLRAYRAFQAAHAEGEATPQHVNDVIVEMRRDLGLSVYGELRTEPLGFDTDVTDPSYVWQTLAAPPAEGEKVPGEEGLAHGNGSTRDPQSHAIASSVRRS